MFADQIDIDANTQHRAERRAEAVEAERDRLIGTPEFDPFTVDHMAEALSEVPAVDLMRASREFKQAAVAAGGGVLYYAIHNYWQRLAEKEAEETILRACQRCFGSGCRSCQDDQGE
jgi:hypothetical protein